MPIVTRVGLPGSSGSSTPSRATVRPGLKLTCPSRQAGVAPARRANCPPQQQPHDHRAVLPPARAGWPWSPKESSGGDDDEPSTSASSSSSSSVPAPPASELLAVTLAGVDGAPGAARPSASPSLAVLTLRLSEAVAAPGLPRTMRMCVAQSQADLITDAAGWAGWAGRGPAPDAAAAAHASFPLSALDTLEASLAALGTRTEAAIIWSFDGALFSAGIVLAGGANTAVRARPSDALILALRAGAPVFVTRDVWAAAAEPVDGGGDRHHPAHTSSLDEWPPLPSPASAAADDDGDATHLPPSLARILDACASADALLSGRHHFRPSSSAPSGAPWSPLSASANRLGAAPHAGLPSASDLAHAARARAEAAASLAALAAGPLSAARARATWTVFSMQRAAAEERYADAAAARARLDAAVAGDPVLAAAAALEAAMDDGRVEDGVRALAALLARAEEREKAEEEAAQATATAGQADE